MEWSLPPPSQEHEEQHTSTPQSSWHLSSHQLSSSASTWFPFGSRSSRSLLRDRRRGRRILRCRSSSRLGCTGMQILDFCCGTGWILIPGLSALHSWNRKLRHWSWLLQRILSLLYGWICHPLPWGEYTYTMYRTQIHPMQQALIPTAVQRSQWDTVSVYIFLPSGHSSKVSPLTQKAQVHILQ